MGKKCAEISQLKGEAAQREREMGALKHRIHDLRRVLEGRHTEIRHLEAELRKTRDRLAQAVLALVDSTMDMLPPPTPKQGPSRAARRKRAVRG